MPPPVRIFRSSSLNPYHLPSTPTPMATITTASLFPLPSSIPKLRSFTRPLISTFKPNLTLTLLPLNPKPRFIVRADDDDDGDSGERDYDMDEDEVEEIDNKKDFDPEYESMLPGGGGDFDIPVADSHGFVSTQGWDSETVVNYRINEEEFHKISLMDCDFFIRKPPDPDNDVYDFREMYVTPPDTDVYSIPKVLAPMPEKYIRCAMSDYGCYNVTEPPIDAPRDPLYKSEREVSKVFLTKHLRNRRLADPEFVLDFEEIYVIDSRTKSITRAKVLVTIPEGRNRDRKDDLLVIRDNGQSFKIIHIRDRENPTTVIEKEDWVKTRQEMERHLKKLRDFSVSNWF